MAGCSRRIYCRHPGAIYCIDVTAGVQQRAYHSCVPVRSGNHECGATLGVHSVQIGGGALQRDSYQGCIAVTSSALQRGRLEAAIAGSLKSIASGVALEGMESLPGPAIGGGTEDRG